MPPRLSWVAASRRFVASFCLAALGAVLSVPASAESLAVAAGAGYKRPLGELGQAFERSSGIAVEASFGNMGQVMAQAQQSDRIILVFGDRAFLERAAGMRFARYLPVGTGRLVLAWPPGSPVRGVDDLARPEVARIALPDPRHAVYGMAARQFLERGGRMASLQSRLLTVATVPQVSAYLASGEVDAGFINLTDALGVRDRLGGFVEVDADAYEPIQIVGGVVAGREGAPTLARFEAFLASPAAREILIRHGL